MRSFSTIVFTTTLVIQLLSGIDAFLTPTPTTSTSTSTSTSTTSTFTLTSRNNINQLSQQPQSQSSSALHAKKQKKKKKPGNSPLIATNRQARRNYEVITTYDAGISLLGSEIKAIRDGKMNLQDGFVRPDLSGRGMSLHNCHIGRHTTRDIFNHEERRIRPLLLRKEECKKLRRDIDIKGFTIVPLKCYFNDKNLVKVQIGLCKGKNVRDKRDAIKDREMKRDTDRMMKSFRV